MRVRLHAAADFGQEALSRQVLTGDDGVVFIHPVVPEEAVEAIDDLFFAACGFETVDEGEGGGAHPAAEIDDGTG